MGLSDGGILFPDESRFCHVGKKKKSLTRPASLGDGLRLGSQINLSSPKLLWLMVFITSTETKLEHQENLSHT